MDKVLAQLDEHFIRLMRNWAAGTVGSSAGFSMSSAYDGTPSGDGYDSRMPILRGEVTDVDAALLVLPIDNRQAVQLFWLFEGRSYAWLAARLKVTDKTVAARCIVGHDMLRRELARRRAMAGQIGRVLAGMAE